MIRNRSIAFTLALIPTFAWAASYRETKDFADAVVYTEQAAERYGAENVLFVVDIDNTLLAMDKPLGSDQWFEWQEYLLANEPNSPHLVAKDFGGLLAAQGLLFAVGTMHPPEPNQPELVAQIQATGVKTLVLTSRGDEFRPFTIRELKRNGYDFATAAPSIGLFSGQSEFVDETCSRFVPYRLDDLAAYGLTREDAELFALPAETRDVSYGDGVLMTAGQHKGAMLLMALKLIGHDYKAVIYVDDHGRHVSRVYDALARRGIDITSIHYKREDANVQRFEYSDKQPITDRWQAIERALAFKSE